MKPAEGHDRAFGSARRLHRIEDVRRATRAADRDHEIAGAGMQLDLLGEDLVIAEVVAEAGQHRAVVERERTDVAVLRIVGRHVAGDGGAASIADEDELVAGQMRAAGCAMT